MAIDPSGRPLMAGPAELQRFHKAVSKMDKGLAPIKSPFHVVGATIDGAIFGALLGFAVHFKDKGHREVGKHALYGAAIGGGLGLLGHLIGRTLSASMHFVEAEARRELQGQPTRTEHLLPLPTDPQYAASGWWDRLWQPYHHRRHHFHQPWREEHVQPWHEEHRHHQPWHEEVVFQPQPPPITYGPASAEEQAAVYSHGGLQ